MSTIVVIEHVPHERLGTFEAPLKAVGCAVQSLKAYERNVRWPDPAEMTACIVMGGPQNVYEQGAYPWLKSERAFLRRAIEQCVPVLGVCLGAQLLADVLGGRVMKSAQAEIGWYPVMREPAAEGDPLFEGFGQTETVFQWHGDTYQLPPGAVRLASSPLCQEQAFRYGDRVYALQFHLEMTEAMIRAWMRTPSGKTELHALQGTVDPLMIKRQSPRHLGRLGELATHVAGTVGSWVKAGRADDMVKRTADAKR